PPRRAISLYDRPLRRRARSLRICSCMRRFRTRPSHNYHILQSVAQNRGFESHRAPLPFCRLNRSALETRLYDSSTMAGFRTDATMAWLNMRKSAFEIELALSETLQKTVRKYVYDYFLEKERARLSRKSWRSSTSI